jgi:hypothetical protein
VLEADTDGQHSYIDRGFKDVPDYRDIFDLDRMIADVLLAPVEEPRARGSLTREDRARDRPQRPLRPMRSPRR